MSQEKKQYVLCGFCIFPSLKNFSYYRAFENDVEDDDEDDDLL